MKRSFLYLAFLTLLTHTIASCSSDLENQDEPLMLKTIEVSFNLDGDFVETSYDSLSRAADSKTYYGIEVQYKTTGNSSYKHYAAGLFDNISDMKITLETGNQYAFYCHVIKEGEDKLYIDSSNKTGCYPFNYLYLDNKFTVSTSSSSYNRNFNATRTNVEYAGYWNGKEITAPQFEGIYYGENIDYTPTCGGIINISLQAAKKYRCKYVINSPSDGSIKVEGPDLSKTISATDKTYSETMPTRIFGSEDHYNYFYFYYSDATLKESKRYKYITDFTSDDVYKKETVNITWNRANGATKNFTQTIAIKSNTITTITVSVDDDALGQSRVSVNVPDDSSMGSFSQNVTVSGGVLVDNTVNPK